MGYKVYNQSFYGDFQPLKPFLYNHNTTLQVLYNLYTN